MLGDVFFEEAVDESDRLVGVYAGQDIGRGEDFLLKKVKLVAVVGVFCAGGQTRLQHEVGLDDPSKAISHLYCHKGRDRFTLDQKL